MTGLCTYKVFNILHDKVIMEYFVWVIDFFFNSMLIYLDNYKRKT